MEALEGIKAKRKPEHGSQRSKKSAAAHRGDPNSPRIDDLYLALVADPPDVKSGRAAVGALTDDDKTAILSAGMIEDWRKLVGTLPASERDWFATELQLSSHTQLNKIASR